MDWRFFHLPTSKSKIHTWRVWAIRAMRILLMQKKTTIKIVTLKSFNCYRIFGKEIKYWRILINFLKKRLWTSVRFENEEREKWAMKDRMRMIWAFELNNEKERKKKWTVKKMSGNRIRPHDIRVIFIGIRELRSAYYKSCWNLTMANIYCNKNFFNIFC